MPLYEYECGQCGRFEIIRKFSDAPLDGCPTCGSPVQKLFSAPAFQFKGSGWYVTDYARKSNGGESVAKGDEPAAKGGPPAAKGGEDKGAAKDTSTPTKTTPKDGAASSSSPSD